LILTGAARRRIFGEYQPTEPSRFLEEIPAELLTRVEQAVPAPRWQQPGYDLRNPYASRANGPRFREREPARTFSYESEDQSESGVRKGMRVRHRQFGVGTVIDVEDHGDDHKVTVRFSSVGTKKLLARFAGLEPA